MHQFSNTDGDRYEPSQPVLRIGCGEYSRDFMPADLEKQPGLPATKLVVRLELLAAVFVSGLLLGALALWLAWLVRAAL